MSGFVAGIKSLTGINSELVVLNKHLKEIVANLNKVKDAASKASGAVHDVAANGGQKNLGTSGNSQMGDSLGEVSAGQTAMPNQNTMAGSMGKFGLYMRNGGGQILSAMAGGALGIAGAALTAMPDMRTVATRSIGYFQSSAGFNMSQGSLERATFSALRSGISSTGADAAVSAILSGRGYLPGSSAYLRATKDVAGVYNSMGIANETAAAAIGGLHSGSTAAKLYSFGININDPRTGKERSTAQIAKDLYKRIFPTGASAEDVSRSFQYGYLGANLRGFGFDDAQQQILYRSMVDMAGGGGGGFNATTSKSSAINSLTQMAESETDLIQDKQDAMLKGFQKGADIVTRLNKAMKDLPDQMYELSGAIGALASTRVGQGAFAALTAATTALTMAFGGLLQMIGLQAGLRALGAGGKSGAGMLAGKLGTKNPGLGKAAGFLGRAGGVLGLLGAGISGFSTGKGAAERGEGFDWGNMAENALLGAVSGFMLAGPWGALAGAGAGAAAYGAGAVAGGGIGGDGDVSGTILPVGKAPITSGFGAPRTSGGKKTSHHGTDYGVPIGTPVKAARAGTVTFAGGSNGHVYGFHVIVDHEDGWETLYGHLKANSFRVSKGTPVAVGQVLALSGDTGNSSGPHLHFEVRRNGKAQNPSTFMKGAGVSSSSATAAPSTMAASGSFLTVGVSGVQATPTLLSTMYGSQSAAQKLGTMSGPFAGAYGNTYGNSDNPASNTDPSKYGTANIGKSGLISLLYKAGFKDPKKLATAYAVMMAESHGNSRAYNDNEKTGDLSYGIFQINMLGSLKQERLRVFSKYGVKKPEDLFDPWKNAQAAAHMSQDGKIWSSWSTYTSGAYKQYLPSKNELNNALTKEGIPAIGGASGATNPTFASIQRGRAASVTSINHAGNTVNITVNVAQASEKEARYLASKVKEILENDSHISAIGGQ